MASGAGAVSPRPSERDAVACDAGEVALLERWVGEVALEPGAAWSIVTRAFPRFAKDNEGGRWSRRKCQ